MYVKEMLKVKNDFGIKKSIFNDFDKLTCSEIKYLLDLLPKIEENRNIEFNGHMAQRKYEFLVVLKILINFRKQDLILLIFRSIISILWLISFNISPLLFIRIKMTLYFLIHSFAKLINTFSAPPHLKSGMTKKIFFFKLPLLS